MSLPAMEIVHAIRDLELASGGPSRSIPQLVMAVDAASVALGWKQHVVFGDRGNANATITTGQRLCAHGVRRDSAFVAFGALAQCIHGLHNTQPISLVHVHGLWSPQLHRIVRWARANSIPYVVSPRGMLSDWCFNHKRFKKRIGWWLYQHNDLKRAAAIHATSGEEQSDIWRMGLVAPVFVVPNGMQVSEAGPEPKQNTEQRLALCITRLHPVKGLDLLIEAWAKLQPAGWKLVIAGPSESGMRERLAHQIQQSQCQKFVELQGEVNGPAKKALLSEAELFVLPSFSENFGMAIAESLAHGIPVITTTGTPWSAVVPNRCGWFVAPDLHGIQKALNEATCCTSEELLEMGGRGKTLIANEYSWNAVANRMMTAYSCVSPNGSVQQD